MEIEVIKGSVVYADADAVVNAANNSLMMGSGVCGAIFEEAGIGELTRACAEFGYCETGAAVITKGFNLKAKYIIHTVGPIYSGRGNEKDLLASCYQSCMLLADNFKCKSLAFCCISTGIYGYPLEEATQIAIQEVKAYQPKHLEKIYFYCYTDKEFAVYNKLLSNKK